MMNKLKITETEKKSYMISHVKDDESLETIAEVFDAMDALLVSYMINKALNKDFDQEDFKNYLVEIAPIVPFIIIPQE